MEHGIYKDTGSDDKYRNVDPEEIREYLGVSGQRINGSHPLDRASEEWDDVEDDHDGFTEPEDLPFHPGMTYDVPLDDPAVGQQHIGAEVSGEDEGSVDDEAGGQISEDEFVDEDDMEEMASDGDEQELGSDGDGADNEMDDDAGYYGADNEMDDDGEHEAFGYDDDEDHVMYHDNEEDYMGAAQAMDIDQYVDLDEDYSELNEVETDNVEEEDYPEISEDEAYEVEDDQNQGFPVEDDDAPPFVPPCKPSFVVQHISSSVDLLQCTLKEARQSSPTLRDLTATKKQ